MLCWNLRNINLLPFCHFIQYLHSPEMLPLDTLPAETKLHTVTMPYVTLHWQCSDDGSVKIRQSVSISCLSAAPSDAAEGFGYLSSYLLYLASFFFFFFFYNRSIYFTASDNLLIFYQEHLTCGIPLGNS